MAAAYEVERFERGARGDVRKAVDTAVGLTDEITPSGPAEWRLDHDDARSIRSG
jgi:hypothetical protein